MTRVCLFLVLVGINQVSLAEVELEVHGISRHFKRDSNLNETNTGLGLNWVRGNYLVSAGQFKNSLYKKSRYLSMGYNKEILEDLSFGVDIGGITGYTGVRFILLPSIKYKLAEILSLKIRFLPAVSKEVHSAMSVSIIVKF